MDIWQSLIDTNVEQFCSDAALDEQVCSELLQREFQRVKSAGQGCHACNQKDSLGWPVRIISIWHHTLKLAMIGCSKMFHWKNHPCLGPWQDPIKSNISWSIPAEHAAHVCFQQAFSCPTDPIPGLLCGEVCKVRAGVKGLAMWLAGQPKSKFSDSSWDPLRWFFVIWEYHVYICLYIICF